MSSNNNKSTGKAKSTDLESRRRSSSDLLVPLLARHRRSLQRRRPWALRLTRQIPLPPLLQRANLSLRSPLTWSIQSPISPRYGYGGIGIGKGLKGTGFDPDNDEEEHAKLLKSSYENYFMIREEMLMDLPHLASRPKFVPHSHPPSLHFRGLHFGAFQPTYPDPDQPSTSASPFPRHPGIRSLLTTTGSPSPTGWSSRISSPARTRCWRLEGERG